MNKVAKQIRACMSIAALVALSVSACAPIQATTNRHTNGQPEEYKSGFHAGCGSGYVAAGHPYAKFSKDVSRYVSDPIYKQGWDDGMNVCKTDYSNFTR